MAHDVFISYASQDREIAYAACEKLERAGITCWIAPRDPVPGIPYGRQLVNAIDETSILLLIFSSHANESSAVVSELELASNRKKNIFPVRIEDVRPGENLEFYVGSVHWLEAHTPPVVAHLESVVKRAQQLLSQRVPRGISLRETLLKRLTAARPKIIALVAPAGFGKSELARQHARSSATHALCDCGGVQTEADFAKGVLAALEDETAERAPELSQRRLLFGQQVAPEASYLQVVVESWSQNPQPSTFVFENVELVDGKSAILELLWRLLGTIPQNRTVIICSRVPLRARFSRFVAPHDIVTLRAEDLAFSPTETIELFQGIAVDDEMLQAVLAQSRGWPVAVLLLARFAREGRLRELLTKTNDVAYGDLYQYLAAEVLEKLPSSTLDVLVACALIPQASFDDIEFGLGSAIDHESVTAALRDLPFVRATSTGALEVHPLVASMLRETYSVRRPEMLKAAAERWERSGNLIRAARLHLERGAKGDAAVKLGALDISSIQTLPIDYMTVLSALDQPDIMRSPPLWYATVHERRFRINGRVLLAEATALFDSIGTRASLRDSATVAVFLGLFLSDEGRHEEAEEMLSALSRGMDIPKHLVAVQHGSIVHIRAAVLSRMGRLAEAQAEFERSRGVISGKHISQCIAEANRAVGIERILGHRDSERALLEEAIELGRGSQIVTLVARTVAEAAFAAWFAGEDDLFERYLDELESLVEREGIPGLAHFVACARNRSDARPNGIETLYWQICASVMRAALATGEEAKRHAEQAVLVADLYGDPAWRAIARVAASQTLPKKRVSLLEEAVKVAELVESPQLNAAVVAVKRGEDDAGLLTPFLARWLRPTSSPQERVLINVLQKTIQIGKATADIGGQEYELLLALSRRRSGITRRELIELMWPDDDESKAMNSLKFALRRIHTRTGRDDVIEYAGDRYALNQNATVDLWQVEDDWRELRGRRDLASNDLLRLTNIVKSLRALTDASALLPKWFDQTTRTLAEIAQQAATLVARHSLERGDPSSTLAMAQGMVEYDAWDETARELVIRALLAQGDHSGALDEWRRYRDVLRKELEVEPSIELTSLLGADAELA